MNSAVQVIRKMRLLFFQKVNYTRKINLNNKKIKIPLISGVSCEISEPWMSDVLSGLLPKQEGIFLDVGVNLGQTLIKVKTIDSERKYIGFEPNPFCVFYVQQLILANSFLNCTLLPVALFTENRLMCLNMFSANENDSSATLIEKFRNDKIDHIIYVPAYNYDGLNLSLNGVGILKIDVEGAELEVIQSLLPVIQKDKPIILIEILPIYSEGNSFRKKRQSKLEGILQNLNYIFYRIEKKRNGSLSKINKIKSIEVHDDLSKSDYIIINHGIAELFERHFQ